MIKTVTTELGGRTITFETGKMAKQANGSVVVSSGGFMPPAAPPAAISGARSAGRARKRCSPAG